MSPLLPGREQHKLGRREYQGQVPPTRWLPPSPQGRRATGGRGELAADSAAAPAHPWLSWQLSLDKELIDFGSYVVGETASRIVTLTNIGGLGTKFKFLRASESCEMDISQSVAKTVSVWPASDQ